MALICEVVCTCIVRGQFLRLSVLCKKFSVIYKAFNRPQALLLHQA